MLISMYTALMAVRAPVVAVVLAVYFSTLEERFRSIIRMFTRTAAKVTVAVVGVPQQSGLLRAVALVVSPRILMPLADLLIQATVVPLTLRCSVLAAISSLMAVKGPRLEVKPTMRAS